MFARHECDPFYRIPYVSIYRPEEAPSGGFDGAGGGIWCREGDSPRFESGRPGCLDGPARRIQPEMAISRCEA